ncbi:MAG: hypothetical protein JWO22_255 [Frankiales bacterium]|nr:hypothetical protein [Frankiales bacterium]
MGGLATAPVPGGLLGYVGQPLCVDLLVAAAVSKDSAEPVAHAAMNLGPLTATKGITLCDLLLGEEVAVVPGLPWLEVEPPYRCSSCTAGVTSLAM